MPNPYSADLRLGGVNAVESGKTIREVQQLDWPSIPCRIVRIDNAAALQLPPVFTSRYRGSIAVRGNNKDELVPEASVYRVWLQPMDNGEPINRAIKGNVLIDGKPESIASSLWRQVAGVLIRELGF
ncbi:MAG: hypothetical protein ACXV8I_11615 [Methylobacter sp.]